MKLEKGYRMDLLVQNCVVLELKIAEAFLPIHEGQILTYLKFANKELRLFINYNVSLFKNRIKRYRV
ncbi:MAG: GxxExxY protein [Sporocytophaga sp.]|nr:GxxExxY protein [Sporocytophaga sp.]